MKCLLVGAGAVGQVYGRHLVLGGAEVTYLVKPKYADEARAGFVMYPLNEPTGRREAVRFTDFELMTDASGVAAAQFDYVFLCVSSTALRAGTWFAELAANLGGATLVNLTPGLDDLAFIGEHISLARVISGIIGLLSYHGPLPGAELPEPGTVYWFPPLGKAPFSGPIDETDALVRTLRAGDFPTGRRRDVTGNAAFGSALLQSHIVALEIAGWSEKALRGDTELFGLSFRAARAALAVAAAARGVSVPLRFRLVRPFMLKAAIGIGARAAPLDLERFFEVHFTKVGDQTEAQLQSWIDTGRAHDVEVGPLEQLRDRLLETREGSRESSGRG